MSSLPLIQCCRVVKNSVSRCVSRSLNNTERREKGTAEPFHSFWPQLWVQKIKTSIYEIPRMWVLILLILLILNLHICMGTLKGLVSSKCSIFTHFVNNRNLGQTWIKFIEWSIRAENCHFRTRFINYGVPFCI